MSTCDERTDDFGVDDRLDGGELDESIWIAYFLPQPAWRDASRARYRMTGAHLELFIGTEHDRWMSDLEGDLRVPSQSLNPMTSSTGAASAITARRESAVRCLGRTVWVRLPWPEGYRSALSGAPRATLWTGFAGRSANDGGVIRRANLLDMEVAFVDRPGGGVDARVVGGDSMFDEVFADCINAIAPSGAPEPTAPSTYWIDRARAYALAANEDPTANPIAHGNVTIVTVENGSVVARFDFDPDDQPGEAIAVGEFIAILDRWREQVLTRSPSAAENYPSDLRTWTVGSNSPPTTPDL